MRVSLHRPSANEIHTFGSSLTERSFNYNEQGASRDSFPAGYDHDRNRILLGLGDGIFAQARNQLRGWQHFPVQWAFAQSVTPQLHVGTEVAVFFRLWGVWWWNAARIVYLIDQPDHYAIAYGTLDGHVERGEEVFYVRREPDGIYYGIEAFSRPAFWGARIAYPLARWEQRRFVNDSLQRMKSITYVD